MGRNAHVGTAHSLHRRTGRSPPDSRVAAGCMPAARAAYQAAGAAEEMGALAAMLVAAERAVGTAAWVVASTVGAEAMAGTGVVARVAARGMVQLVAVGVAVRVLVDVAAGAAAAKAPVAKAATRASAAAVVMARARARARALGHSAVVAVAARAPVATAASTEPAAAEMGLWDTAAACEAAAVRAAAVG